MEVGTEQVCSMHQKMLFPHARACLPRLHPACFVNLPDLSISVYFCLFLSISVYFCLLHSRHAVDTQ